jgi:hypothetical protein
MPQSGHPSRDAITNIGLRGMDAKQVSASEIGGTRLRPRSFQRSRQIVMKTQKCSSEFAVSVQLFFCYRKLKKSDLFMTLCSLATEQHEHQNVALILSLYPQPHSIAPERQFNVILPSVSPSNQCLFSIRYYDLFDMQVLFPIAIHSRPSVTTAL